MQKLVRPTLLVTVVLLVPILPFVGFGQSMEQSIERWIERTVDPTEAAVLVAGVLATDVFLPVPSSFVSTAGGMRLGVTLGTLASWLGMTVGAAIAFGLARWFGRPLAVRLSPGDDLEGLDRLSRRFGPHLIVLTRAIPVLAEASVLLMGATGLRWRPFFTAAALSNLGIALAYSALGHYARVHGAMLVALAASIVLPVLAAVVARRVIGRQLSAG